ncbi:uncharacterized protein LOC121897964 isoform X2 [Thunnus maccoyii]|uniref:uncharacterized protein LOC121897964 isoform X2 n=1 Tax=Thunnus maccoyii TaxID=8240 RepID=UPI001C4A91B1|nr:uncharacterized protein LOC121897964 isoform X2 [Thunnus maccoyii]
MKTKACWLPKPENSCEGVRPFQRRWAFNPTSGLCEDFLYCTGNSSNSFPSFNACRDQCMLGACCLRKPSLPTGHQHHSHHGYNISSGDSTLGQYDHYNLEDETLYGNIDFNLTELEDLKENLKRDQEKTIADCYEDPDFTYTCDYLTLMQCQALVKDQAGEAQVVSFSPGLKCSDVRCGGGCGCFSQRKLWRYGERFRQGCEKCICTHSGRIDCVCRHLTQRKEIRDLTLRERSLYQKAVRKLYARPAVWKGFALLRAEFSPQTGDHAFFLPWHRYFLRLVERELQSLSSCKLGIPYFEWTVDSGSMQSSAAWEAGLFGGDGKAGSGCVQYHPFQGRTSRFHWSPCLRRSFNSSVWLPDAVTLQRTLNQADFQLFSQSLQTFSGLFRLWVGGLMASPLAAYDPLYLSHMAFMDKLWAQWQEKHQYGSDRQTSKEDPARQRHMKMKPFDVTPDDVISSDKQMCVIYVPITIGAPCNMTSLQTHLKGSLKYQKHSFTKTNSHHCGFVSRGFDSNGFDQDGYDREGYDQSGWDRLGFGKDGFNRDFIDRDGYDVSGFNRYGFNRSNVTWFGMRWDGMFKKDKKEHEETGGEDKSDQKALRDKIMSELFSDKGYSIYGFDPFSLDRGGFDAFGFRTDGYDKDGCNWFFNGPHYLRFYFHTQQQLMSSSDQALDRITRICPPITSLPQHWAIQDWMIYNPDESSASNGQPEQDWVEQNKQESDDTIMAATQNRSTTWLPITPDHRFCFKLHWFSGCPLGSAPITCPELCHQARCHGYPEAVCHMHNCGSCFTEWRDPATGNHVICHGW